MRLTDEFLNPNNKFYLSTYGSILALGFCGADDFINRSYNMSYNHSIARGELKILEEGFKYCLTTKEKLIAGLKNYFINEIKFLRDILPLKEETIESENEDGTWNLEYVMEYNEPEIEKLAQTKLDEFLEKYIEPKSFMVPPEKNIDNSIYEISMDKGRGMTHFALKDLVGARDDKA